MTDPATLATAGVAAALSLAIGWLSWPREPDLDGERLFKTVLATLLRGEVEAADGSADDWADAVVANAPYHPAGRFPERKVTGSPVPSAAIDGERALIEKLASLPDVPARWAWMYDEDPTGLAARLDDPIGLGRAYDPSQSLGTAATWDALADWGANEGSTFREALVRGLAAYWFVVGSGDMASALCDTVEGARRMEVGARDVLEDALAAAMEDPAHRFVLVGIGPGIVDVLGLLEERAPLRDRVVAVISVGGVFDRAWMESHFTHHRFDTELTRRTPYFSLAWLDRTTDPPAGRGVLLEDARFPDPRSESLTQEYVLPVDLGVVYEGSDCERIARGLWVTVGCWVNATG